MVGWIYNEIRGINIVASKDIFGGTGVSLNRIRILSIVGGLKLCEERIELSEVFVNKPIRTWSPSFNCASYCHYGLNLESILHVTNLST